MVRQALTTVYCQCLCPQGELQVLAASVGDSPRSTGRSDSGSFQITTFPLGPRPYVILCVLFKSGVYVHTSPLELLKLSHSGLKSQIFWGAHALYVELLVLGSQCGAQTPQSLGKPLQLFVCILNHFTHVWLFAPLWTIACQAPLSMRLSRQEYWSGLLYSPPGNIFHLGIEPTSLMSSALAATILSFISFLRRGMGIDYIATSFLLTIFLWFLLSIFVCIRPFLVDSGLFYHVT